MCRTKSFPLIFCSRLSMRGVKVLKLASPLCIHLINQYTRMWRNSGHCVQ